MSSDRKLQRVLLPLIGLAAMVAAVWPSGSGSPLTLFFHSSHQVPSRIRTSYRQTRTTLAARFILRVNGIRMAPKSFPSYRVRPGDTLSGIAQKMFHNGREWPALWWANRRLVPDPNVVRAGQVLVLDAWQPQPWLLQAAHRALPDPPPVSPAPVSDPQPVTVSAVSGAWPGGAFGNCVVSRESGGNPDVWNASGHWGLYQFAPGTWAEYGGSPASFGNASVAEQEAVFMNAMARGGEFNWAPYDGC
jgi:hypothetical protein